MKRDTQNNPVVVGALLCILAGAMVVTIQRMRVDDGPQVVVRQTTPSASAAPASAQYASLRETAARDPFFHPILLRVAPSPPDKAPSRQPQDELPSRTPRGLRPAFPFGLPSLRPLADSGADAAPSADRRATDGPITSKNLAPPSQTPPPDSPEQNLVRSLKLTAVVGGVHRSAVIEGAAALPMTVRVGDRIETLRVVAVNPREAVLSGAHGIWTLPLASASKEEADPAPAPPKENADAGR